MRRTRYLTAAAVAACLVALPACGSSDDEEAGTTGDTTATTAASGSSGSSSGKKHTEMTPEELEVWQKDLNAVGCWAGPVDGELGPQTEAAIKEFQAAEGLTVDGLLGPATEGALDAAASAGKTVCVATTTTTAARGTGTTTGSGGTTSTTKASSTASVSVSAPNYSKTFEVTTCTPTQGGTTGVVLRGSGEGNINLAIDAPSGTGTISISGGTEQDGVNLSGTVSRATVSDAAVSVSGTFADGTAFTVSGTCA